MAMAGVRRNGDQGASTGKGERGKGIVQIRLPCKSTDKILSINPIFSSSPSLHQPTLMECNSNPEPIGRK